MRGIEYNIIDMYKQNFYELTRLSELYPQLYKFGLENQQPVNRQIIVHSVPSLCIIDIN